MIKTITIKNYKSIEDLTLQCRKVNVIIGEPNTGKSNILEAITMLNPLHPRLFEDIIRYEFASELYNNRNTKDPIVISSDEADYDDPGKDTYRKFTLVLDSQEFTMSYFGKENTQSVNFMRLPRRNGESKFTIGSYNEKFTPVRNYIYSSKTDISMLSKGFLEPPYGDNLFQVIYENKDFENYVKALLNSKGIGLHIDEDRRVLQIIPPSNDTMNINSIGIKSLSDTFRRMIFYYGILYSNQKAVIILEEPESFTFPLYTKQLGESIAEDETNQFFIVTHNPYLLSAIVEKTPMENLQVSIATKHNNATKLYQLSNNQLRELCSSGYDDLFFNLSNFMEAE